MTIKKAIIVTLFLCLLIIGSVSATSDINNTISPDVTNEKISHTTSTDTNSNCGLEKTSTDNKTLSNKAKTSKKNSSNTTDKISSTQKNVLTKNSGTFSELQTIIDNAKPGDTIKLNKDYICTGNEIYSVGLDIASNDLTIDGNGHTLNGNNLSSIMALSPKTTLSPAVITLKNINFINGYASYNNIPGGAVNTANIYLTITNCKFNNNFGSVGGAIYSFINGYTPYKPKLTIKNCKFNNNLANRGGAIHICNAADVTINKCTFTNNKAGLGGAIFTLGEDIPITITNSEFKKNAADSGKDIYLYNGNNAKIHKCIFKDDNTINCYSGSVDLSDCKSNKNTPKIIAKTKKFNRKIKTKKYTITLKNKQNNKPIKQAKVTIKINKKTYHAQTNTKGKATFKITKLNKKGKYTATITFKGNKSYKKATKKVKITIK